MEFSLAIPVLHGSLLRNDMEAVRQILSKCSVWLRHPDSLDFFLKEATKIKFEEEIVNVLVKYKATDNLGKLLAFAVSRGKVSLTESLLKNGATVQDLLDCHEDSSAILCITNSQILQEMLQLLVQYGLKISEIRNCNGQNLLHQFVKYHVLKRNQDAVKIAEILINFGVRVDDNDNNDDSSLDLSIPKQNIGLTSFLIKQGADVNRKSKCCRRSPLLKASQYNNEDLVGLLLSSGADADYQDKYGFSALHVACLSRNQQVISLLLKSGAHISPENKDGRTPFSLLEPHRWNDKYERCNSCIITMIKEFSKLRFSNVSVSEKDMNMIQANARTREHFDWCTAALDQMASEKFYNFYSYHSVLKMSKKIKKLACLLKNKEFVSRFVKNFRAFPYYETDLQKTFDEAIVVRDRLVIADFRLHSAIGNVFPIVVMRNILKYLTVEDLPVN